MNILCICFLTQKRMDITKFFLAMHQRSSKINFVSLTMIKKTVWKHVFLLKQNYLKWGLRGKNWIYKTTQPIHSHMFFPESLASVRITNTGLISERCPIWRPNLLYKRESILCWCLVSCFLQLGVFQIPSTSACFIWNSKLVNHTSLSFQDCCCCHWNSYWQVSLCTY